HQDATYQDHSRIPSQSQRSPLIGLGHKTLHEDVFGPNHLGLGVHHREQSRAPEQPMSPFQEQPNNAIQEGRKHVRSPGVERSTSYMAYMPPPQTQMVGTHLRQLGPVQNYNEPNPSSHAGTPYLGHSSHTPFSHSSGSSRSQSLAPHGGTQSPHEDYQPLYSALGHNHQMTAHASFRNSALLQMEQGYDPRDSSHATVGKLVAEVQRLSIATNQLFVALRDLVASNEKLTIQA
ncbi:hypothetical protein AZE42_13069, partial [Rhizopogon vesiculosus]